MGHYIFHCFMKETVYYATLWMNPGLILLREVSQSREDKYVISLI